VACSIGLFEVINLLISHGAEVNVLSIQGQSLLIMFSIRLLNSN